MIVIIRELELGWTPDFNILMENLSIFNLNIDLTSPECFLVDQTVNYSYKLKITLALPILFGTILLLFALGNVAIRRFRFHRVKFGTAKVFLEDNTVKDFDHHKENYFMIMRAVNAMLLFVYATVTSKSLAFFDCKKEADDFYYLGRLKYPENYIRSLQ